MAFIGNQPADKILGPEDIQPNSIEPDNLTTGHPTWDTSGNFVSPGDITAFSDERLKTEIATIENALQKINQLRGVSFTRKDTGRESIGVIAQEVQKIIPEVILESSDGYLSVAYGNIIAVLIEAVKELHIEVQELKAKNGG